MSEEPRRGDPRGLLITLTFANLITILGGAWYFGGWTSTVTAEQRHTTEALNALQMVVYTKSEAQQRDRIYDVQLGDLARRVNMIEESRKGSR